MNKGIYRLFIFTLLFAPLAFGTVEPWSLTVMETSSLLAFLLLLFWKLRNEDAFFYETPGLIPLLCLLVLMGIQLLPMPGGIVKIISPETYDIYKKTIFINDPVSWVCLSINKKATLVDFFRVASYVVFYTLTIQVLSKKDVLKKTVATLIIFASFLSLFAILQRILWNNKIYWIRELTLGGTPFGPYVNRNHYAGLMEMLFPLVLSLFLFYKPPRSAYKSFRDKITELFNIQRTNIYILLGFSSVLIATSLFLTLSRSGIVSLCISMIFFGVLLLSRGANKRRGVIIIVIFILIVLSVAWFGWTPIIERFERLKDTQGHISELRLEIWKDSRNIIKDFPLTGTGFGSFLNIYPKYRTISGNAVADHAHNDYIEVLSEGGIPAFFLCMCFLTILFYKSYRVFLRRREIYSVYLFIAAVSGMLAILIHSFTDFNLRIGANGLYFFFLAGLAVSSANTRLRNGLNDTYLKKTRLPLKWVTALSIVMLLGCFIFQSGVTIGRIYFSSIRDIRLNERTPHQELVAIKDAAYRASFFDPLEAQYRYASANIERNLGSDSALEQYKGAVRMDPVNGEYLERLGFIMSELGEYGLADKLLQAGITYDVSNPGRYRRYALWLFSMGRMEEGISITRTAISLEPQKTKEYITLMVLDGFSDEEILVSLPERVEPHLRFADYLSGTGKDKMAEEEYLHALQYIKKEGVIRPEFFYAVYGFYLKRNRFEDALNIMQKAADALPHDAGIKMHKADLYEKLRASFNAAEEYRKILLNDPENQEAKRRLENLLLKNKGL
jgi:O-antigen ligase